MEIEGFVIESAGSPKKVNGRWLVTIAKPGRGSTGVYHEDSLRTTGPAAFPPGTKSFFNHDPKRDVRDMVGTFPEGAFWNEEAGELQGFLEPFPRYAPVLEEAGANIEASIHASALKDPQGNVRSLLPNRANTVDLVAFAGLEGSGLKFQVESLFAAAAAEEEKEGDNVTVDERLEALTTALTAHISEFRTFVSESRTATQSELDQAAIDAAVETGVAEALAAYSEKEAAIDAAGLLPAQAAALKARAMKGEEVEEALAEAVAIVEEAKATFVVEPEPNPYGVPRAKVVVANESAKDDASDLIIGRWSK